MKQLSLLLCLKYLYKRKIVLLSIISVTMSCALLIVVAALFSGFIAALEKSFRDTMGDIVITAPRERKIPQYDELIAELEADSQIVAAAPVLANQGGLLYLGPGNVRGVFMFGVDLRQRNKVTPFAQSLLRQKEGEPEFTLTDYPDETGGFVGIGVVARPDEKTDEYDFEKAGKEFISRKVSLTTATAQSEKPVVIKFRVSDIVYSGIFKLDEEAVYLPIEVLTRHLYASEEKICDMVQIKLADGVETAAALERIQAIWERFAEGKFYWAMNADIETSIQKQVHLIAEYRKQMGMLMLIFGLVSGGIILLIFCIFYMIVMSKRKDIAVIKSCGLGSCSVAGLFLAFGCAIGITGSAFGVLTGYYITKNINAVERFISSMLGLKLWKSSTYMFTKIPNEVDWSSVVWIVAAAIAASVLGAVLPAIAAARIQPVKLLRYE